MVVPCSGRGQDPKLRDRQAALIPHIVGWQRDLLVNRDHEGNEDDQPTFSSAKVDYKITVNPARRRQEVPVVMLIHGNFGLNPPYGDEIRNFALALSSRGYVTAVPQYYADDEKHLGDTVPYVQTLCDAITDASGPPGADPSRIGLIAIRSARQSSFHAASARNGLPQISHWSGGHMPHRKVKLGVSQSSFGPESISTSDRQAVPREG